MIELSGIRKAFNQGRDNEFWALNGIDLRIQPRQVTVFFGPSGSGKTTLLTLVGCLARPTTGRVRLKGRDISGLPERFLTEIRRRTFGFIFQQFNLIKGLSAVDNVMLPAEIIGIPRDQQALIFESFHQVGSNLLNAPREGVGLGLSISRQLARLMGGEIVVDSTPGAGSRFTLRLPIVKQG